MVSLLDLPFELREKVWRYALQDEVLETPNATDLANLRLRRRGLDSSEVRSWETSNALLHPKGRPPVSSLFHISRQVRREMSATRDVLRRTHAILDLAFISMAILVPTWQLLPKEGRQVQHLTCRIRSSGLRAPYYGQSYVGWRGSNARPGLSWILYELLERFGRFGPGWERAADTSRDGYSIAALVVDVDTLHEEAEEDLPEDSVGQQIFAGSSAYFVNCLIQQIGGLLHMDYHTASYGDILYAHVGEISVHRDGEHVHTFDLGSILEGLTADFAEATITRRQREAAFRMWKPLCIAQRARLGFADPCMRLEASFGIDEDTSYATYDECRVRCGSSWLKP